MLTYVALVEIESNDSDDLNSSEELYQGNEQFHTTPKSSSRHKMRRHTSDTKTIGDGCGEK